MIGGYDIILFHELPEAEALELLVSTAKALWPSCVLEPDDWGPNEVFVYETQEAKDSWDTNGATDENDPKMVHLITSAGQATIVYSSKDAELTRKYIGMVLLAKDKEGTTFPFWFYK
jgi:hypothetical protein